MTHTIGADPMTYRARFRDDHSNSLRHYTSATVVGRHQWMVKYEVRLVRRGPGVTATGATLAELEASLMAQLPPDAPLTPPDAPLTPDETNDLEIMMRGWCF